MPTGHTTKLNPLPRGTRPTPPVERFWPRVDKRGPSECWLWKGGTHSEYGRIHNGVREVGVHRFSYELHNGPIPAGMWVLHRCDNPLCVNPAHLFLGTHEENMADMIAKGRSTKGPKNPNARLTWEKVKEIRCAPGTWDEIGARFGISGAYAGRIKSGHVWREDSQRSLSEPPRGGALPSPPNVKE